jgi:RNA recognition motif-containing protein
VTKDELNEAFGKFGKIVDVEIPFRKKGKGVPLGIGFIRYETSEAAISAYAEMDKTFF